MKKINLKPAMDAYRREDDLRNKRVYVKDDHGRAVMEAQAALFKSLDPIDAEIHAAEGRATTGTLTANQLVRIMCRLEDRLGIPKKALQGVIVRIDAAPANLPHAYKHLAYSTQCRLEFRNGHWSLLDVRRDRVTGRKTNVRIIHTEASRAALQARFNDMEV